MKFSHYQLQLKFWPSMVALLMLAVLFSLGTWQIKRYDYKKQLMHQYQQAISQNPIDFSQLNTQQDVHFQHVHILGTYLNNYTMLLENRFYHDKIGFEILTPFRINHSDFILLVNRGWTPMIANQQIIPIKPTIGEQQITGLIQVLGYQGFTLGPAILTPIRWPLLIQKIDLPSLHQLTHLDFYPFILRLDANQPTGFVNEWKPITVLPQRHLGYAIQWFAMAIALIIAFGCLSCKKREKPLE